MNPKTVFPFPGSMSMEEEFRYLRKAIENNRNGVRLSPLETGLLYQAVERAREYFPVSVSREPSLIADVTQQLRRFRVYCRPEEECEAADKLAVHLEAHETLLSMIERP